MNKQMITLIFSSATVVFSMIWLWAASDYSKDGYEPILALLAGLSGMLGVFIWISLQGKCTKGKKEYDVFLSTPMTSINNTDYSNMHDLSVSLIETIKKYTNEKIIYSASLVYKNISDIDDEVTSAKNDLHNLKRSRSFILIYPEKIATSCLVEVGYAIGLNIPCVFFVHDKNDLPYMLREIGQIKENILIYTYSDTDNLKNTIRRKGNDLFSSSECRY